MPRLVLLRHGQSQWNLENRFTGWVDVDLTSAGEAEASSAGERIAAAGIALDHAFASVQTRAIRTAVLALSAAGPLWIPLEKSWRLNERHYGALTGLDKAQTAQEHGEAQVRLWRRSYDIAPPPLAPGGPYDFAADRRYRGMTPPATESLKTTLERVDPYWREAIAPTLSRGAAVLVAAHGNSLRALIKILFRVGDEEIVAVEFPTGNPLLIDLSAEIEPLAARYLDPATAKPLPALP
ncbi:MAG: 2,3-bisphosphoglycerate-dependent phosphoglycerate mutase [Candidatus Dormibacteria bacterium]